MLRTLPLKTWIIVVFLGASLVGSVMAAWRKKSAQLTPSVAVSTHVPAVAVYFSTAAEISQTVSQFQAPEFIYARLVFSDRVYGKNTLEGRWVAPGGGPQEFTRVPLDFGARGGSEAYLWLRFHDNSSGGGLLLLTPADEQVKRDFNGAWTLQTLWNGQFLANSTFSISGMTVDSKS